MGNYIVYMHTTPSGKRYIGITSQLPCQRWKRGKHYKTQVFGRAVEKYGWDNIKHEILHTGLTEEEAKAKEIELIAKYRTTEYEYGYNITQGGNTSSNKGKPPTEKQLNCLKKGWKESEKRKRKVICLETLKVYDSIVEAKTDTGATNISSCLATKGVYKKSGGYHWSYYDSSKDDEYYNTLLTEMTKTSHKLSRAIICLETMETYSSIQEAIRQGIATHRIVYCLKNGYGVSGGYHWAIFDKTKDDRYYKELLEKQKSMSYKPPINTKESIERFRQRSMKRIICVETNELFNSLTEASKEKAVSLSNICKSCKDNKRMAGGFHWKYL